MKKVLVCVVFACALAACKKNQTNNPPVSGPTSIVGNWELNKVTSYFIDSTGVRDSDAIAFPIPPNNDRYGYQFNPDDTWKQLFLSTTPATVSAIGTYANTSDSTFTLFYPGASPARIAEPCKILLLTNTQFIFSKQQATLFNGIDSGYIKRVFILSR